MDPQLLYDDGIALCFPLIDLQLALSMYYAARWLVAIDGFSFMLLVFQSILPSGTLATLYIKVYLRQELAKVIDTYEMASTGVFVDDISQMIAGISWLVVHLCACVCCLVFCRGGQGINMLYRRPCDL